jgi:hypothetical protein
LSRPARSLEATAAEEAEDHQDNDDDHDDQQNGERWPPSGDGTSNERVLIPSSSAVLTPAPDIPTSCRRAMVLSPGDVNRWQL